MYLLPVFWKEIDAWKGVYEDFLDYGLKPNSAIAYTRSLRRLCEYAQVSNPYTLLELGLDKIERLTLQFIRTNEAVKAPKYLNVIYCAIKRWCVVKELIKSARMFREIKFDKSSRKTQALMETTLETRHIKNGFKVSALDKKVDWGLYGLVGLRPALIPQLRVRHIFPRNKTIEDGKISLVKPTLVIIPRDFRGNKGNITFFVFIPTRLAELIELELNSNGTVTEETKISRSDNTRAVYYRIKQIYEKIGFKGRPYLLRSYADNLLERITRIHNDEDFKEFLMGHKGRISAVYQMKGLTMESEKLYRDMYASAVDQWTNENIFEIKSKTERDNAEMLIRGALATAIELNMKEIEMIRDTFGTGNLSFDQFTDQLKHMAQQALQARMRTEFEKLAEEWFKNRNNKGAK